MKKYGIIGVIAVAVVAAGVWGWKALAGRDDSMASSLPQDVTLVGRLDLKTLVLDYGLDFADLKRLLTMDGRETGIKYQTAAYFFASQGCLGGILPLSSDDDFEALLQEEGLEIEEQRGLRWSVVDGSFLLTFDGDGAMFMGPAVGAEQDALRNTLAACMKQKASESGKQSRLYQLLDKREEPLALSGTLEGLSTDMLAEITKYVNIPLDRVDLTAGFTVHKDRLALNFGLLSEDDATNRQLETLDKVLGTIDGDLNQTLPTNALLHLVMGVDGADLLQLLRENRVLRTLLLAANMVLDLDMILKSVDGDVALSCLSLEGELPTLLFQAKLDDDKFMKNVSNWNDARAKLMGFNFYMKDKENGVCTFQGLPIYFGTHDKRLAISNQQSLAEASAHTDVALSYASEMKGSRIYASLDVRRLLPYLPTREMPARLQVWLKRFDRLSLGVRNVHDIDLLLWTPDGIGLEAINE